ncbi:hypothetical protein ACM01_02070 [Streptomyces viridochromogenes]|uniref:Uncharacterized protein n=1 Tax=Streptomyces viridochromogenes TaxID=1938 RepID=A0A0J7ZMQ2_STRVR|nr:hypothetical protein ACM01_02070 [Streptomyces viridochromogenes]
MASASVVEVVGEYFAHLGHVLRALRGEVPPDAAMTFLASSAACSGSFASARATASHDRYGATSRACVAP